MSKKRKGLAVGGEFNGNIEEDLDRLTPHDLNNQGYYRWNEGKWLFTPLGTCPGCGAFPVFVAASGRCGKCLSSLGNP